MAHGQHSVNCRPCGKPHSTAATRLRLHFLGNLLLAKRQVADMEFEGYIQQRNPPVGGESPQGLVMVAGALRMSGCVRRKEEPEDTRSRGVQGPPLVYIFLTILRIQAVSRISVCIKLAGLRSLGLLTETQMQRRYSLQSQYIYIPSLPRQFLLFDLCPPPSLALEDLLTTHE